MKLDLNEIYDNVLNESHDLAPHTFAMFGTIASTDILLNLVKDQYIEKHRGMCE